MDLAADQTTMYFGQEGGEVKRWNLATNSALSDFSSDVENAFAMRILGNGNVLVADGADIELLNSSGTQIFSYDINTAGLWFALNIDDSGSSFWSATTDGLVAEFDIATGAILNQWNSLGFNGTWGLAIFGEVTQGGGGGLEECSTHLISDIINPSLYPDGFTCTLGDKTFSEFNGIGDLAGGKLTFSASDNIYQLLFDDLNLTSDISFNYKVVVNDLAKSIVGLGQTFGGSATPTINDLISSESLPTSDTTLVSTLSFPSGSVTSITQTITQTPGPLSILGAGTAFGFSRKLRRRIKLSA